VYSTLMMEIGQLRFSLLEEANSYGVLHFEIRRGR
jgi:hypothetical protein